MEIYEQTGCNESVWGSLSMAILQFILMPRQKMSPNPNFLGLIFQDFIEVHEDKWHLVRKYCAFYGTFHESLLILFFKLLYFNVILDAVLESKRRKRSEKKTNLSDLILTHRVTSSGCALVCTRGWQQGENMTSCDTNRHNKHHPWLLTV